MSQADKVIITCALTGVLTDPAQHKVPVTASEMADAAEAAYNAGATVVHCHYRMQQPGMGRFPTWDAEVVAEIDRAIRSRVPQLIVNMSTGVVGADISGPLSCLRRIRPEMAALNAGSLNYLKTRADGRWAWPPLLFDNPVEKVEAYIRAMNEVGTIPECECFDTGIVRSIALFQQVGLLRPPAHISLVMGVASGMPAKAEWLPLLVDEMPKGAHFQTILIGREEVWAVHRRSCELGGNLRTGVEDTFYLPSGEKTDSNGRLIEALVQIARECGREPASPAEARALIGISDLPHGAT
ncbi:MAG: 3-keto-5-aminohexanoate cleavage protein [Myxococcales bacterium]|nr:3-keto-5-aminohexanoate cleavage protein [Myxococcales bacterium]